jgi:D-3-phosphoglycerate dehydrogenase
VTLGAANLPEVNLRSLTLDEQNHARVSRNCDEGLDKIDEDRLFISITTSLVCSKRVRMSLLIHDYYSLLLVNEILGDHNVDKQITDNKGDVRNFWLLSKQSV